jgi:hypothetical protein
MTTIITKRIASKYYSYRNYISKKNGYREIT